VHDFCILFAPRKAKIEFAFLNETADVKKEYKSRADWLSSAADLTTQLSGGDVPGQREVGGESNSAC